MTSRRSAAFVATPRQCAFVLCGRTFTPRNKCHTRCTKRCEDAERLHRRVTKPARHPKARFIYEALEESEPGMCPWGCETPLPPRCRTCCRNEECRRYYQRAYRIGRTRVEREIRTPERRAPCKCGCGGEIITRRKPGSHDYLPGHRRAFIRRREVTFAQVVQKVRAA